MEIKNVTNKKAMEYPTLQEIDKKTLKNNIPNKWFKLGITGFIFSMLMRSKAFANSYPLIRTEVLGGERSYINTPLVHEQITPIGYTFYISCILSIILLLANIICFAILRCKIKKGREEKDINKIKKILKALFIALILLVIFNIIMFLLIEYDFIDLYELV